MGRTPAGHYMSAASLHLAFSPVDRMMSGVVRTLCAYSLTVVGIWQQTAEGIADCLVVIRGSVLRRNMADTVSTAKGEP